RGVIESINAKYELLPRGSYVSHSRPGQFVPVRVNKRNPFELFEAENAIQMARLASADKYAGESFQQASQALEQARPYQADKPGRKPVITMAREAVLRAEDARVLSIRRQQDEALANERRDAAARQAAEQAKAEEARKNAESERLRAELASRDRAAAEA